MRQPLFTIAPHAPFLPTLADRILDGTLLGDWPRHGPFWLSDVTILLPTRRAELALAEQFVKRGIGLLPDIRALGDEDDVEQLFLPPIDAPPPPPAASALERRLVLARLIDAWARHAGGRAGLATPPSPAEVFRLAESLAGLADDLTIERRTAADLRAIAPEALAANWQQALEFLDIALTAWPAVLTERGLADRAALRNQRLERQAATASLVYGERPVIVAGSTGSVPATADLVAAIAALPRGVIVLPGLDTGLTLDELVVLTDAQAAPHGHAQYGLVKLVTHLGARPDAVTELAPPHNARTGLVRRALALADRTALWAETRSAQLPLLPEALAGVAILAAPGEDLEARAIAIAAREALAAKRSVGIISPDRNLARRIAAELRRYAIEVDDAAGTPLFQSPAGRLARLVLAAVVEQFAPVALMALLRHPAVRLGLERWELGRRAGMVDLRLLRGRRAGVGIAGLRRALLDLQGGGAGGSHPLDEEHATALAELFDRLEAGTAPLAGLVAGEATDAVALVEAVTGALAELTRVPEGEAAGDLPGRAELDAWATGFAGRADAGPRFRPAGLDAVLAALMSGVDVRSAGPARADIAIWGRLEARLQRPERMILAGLNEDVWPEPADPGPWLSRGMRLAAGLEPPERRQGQAAHDFEMAIGNPDVILSYASRRGSSPALPSPLLQRLEAYAGKEEAAAMRARGALWLEQAIRLDATPSSKPAGRPEPRPPAAIRPRQLSITEVETLFRSPYDIYARHVLKLRALAPLGEEADARDRGTMVHDVFARFVAEGRDFAAPEALEVLRAMAVSAFSGLDAIGERRDIWLKRFERAAELFLDFERERDEQVRQRHAEIKGAWIFPMREPFTLTGRADRIDEMRDGTLQVIDFKTGSVPSPGTMRDDLAPQLPLEAFIGGQGGFEGVPRAAASALTYVKIGLGPDAFRISEYAADQPVPEIAERMSMRLQRQVEALLLRGDLAMVSQLLPDLKKRFAGEFDHLARVDEWAVAEEDEQWNA